MGLIFVCILLGMVSLAAAIMFMGYHAALDGIRRLRHVLILATLLVTSAALFLRAYELYEAGAKHSQSSVTVRP
jgi:hypothetical protein